MKTGILTFIHTGNYGAVLQSYAMQTLLNFLGVETEFIDYTCPSIQKNHDPKMLWHKSGLKNKLLFPVLYFVYGKRLKNFSKFENEHLKFSPVRYRRDNIASCAERYENFLVGSDQVWNPALTNGDMSYFLDFISDDGKKLSYAASMGTADFPKEYEKPCTDLISSFSCVNVREKSSAQALKAAGINANSVLDPTLMLNKEHWMRFVGERPHKRKYIFMYMPPSDAESVRKIRAYAKENNFDVFRFQKGIKPTYGFKTLNTLSPTEFLTWLYHSELVISGSFHGVCFSVLFEKKFLAFSSPTKNLTGRIDDLLSDLCLTEQKFKSELVPSHINYTAVSERLNALRNESLKLLKQAVAIKK